MIVGSPSGRPPPSEPLPRSALSAYYKALMDYVGGLLDVVFPEGTWFMKKRFGVSCCRLPDS
jgi:hypothetical protein